MFKWLEKILWLRALLPERRAIRWLFRLYIPATLFTGFALICPLLAPDRFLFAGFVVFAIPFLLLLQLFFLLLFLLASPVYAVAPLAILLIAWNHVCATFAWNRLVKPGELKVVSLNVETFRGYARHTPERMMMAHHILQYLEKTDADVLCLQEFYDKPSSYIYSTCKRLAKAGFAYNFYSKTGTFDKAGTMGMVIFSRYPIVNSGVVYKPEKNNNQIIWSEIKTPLGMVRVYSLHLESIRLKAYEMDLNKDQTELQKNARSVSAKLLSGFVRRGAQFQLLLEALQKSKYPVILCGDFNEVPYSYVYNTLKTRYQSAFEEAGRGFGFTFNGMIPFLRIDNQFVDKRLITRTFMTNYAMNASDHFPLEASYSLADEDE